jgi:hypothetical protein
MKIRDDPNQANGELVSITHERETLPHCFIVVKESLLLSPKVLIASVRGSTAQ